MKLINQFLANLFLAPRPRGSCFWLYSVPIPCGIFLSGVGKHEECHLGSNPAHAVVTRKDNSDIDNIKKILTDMSDRYGVNQKNWNQFQLFNSSRYNGSNLIFKDSATALKGIPADQQSYMAYLGDNYGKNVEALTSCDYLSTTAAPKKTLTPISASTVTSPVTAFMLFTTLLSILFM